MFWSVSDVSHRVAPSRGLPSCLDSHEVEDINTAEAARTVDREIRRPDGYDVAGNPDSGSYMRSSLSPSSISSSSRSSQ